MAAYAATVVIKSRYHEKIGIGKIGMIRGTIDVTNYNQTTAPITAITKHFRDEPTVIISSISTLGYGGTWLDSTTDSVKCWNYNYDASDGPAQQAASDTNCGVFDFVAFGRV